tara:strand:+ start:462 stop:2813 length:2352 start_codon:yes stop_codon:yes gene_type:complete
MKNNKVAQILKEEMEYARNTRTAAIKHAQLKREHKDFDSQVILRLIEEAKGYQIDPELLNEGFWDSAKAFMAKFQGKRLAGKETGDFGAAKMQAIDKESQKMITSVIDELPSGWPNVKTTEEFVKGITMLAGIDQSIRKAAMSDPPKIPVDVAESLLDALRDIVSDYESELSYVYRYTNEDKEGDGEVLSELSARHLLTPSNLRRTLRFAKKGYDQLRPRQQDRLEKTVARLSKLERETGELTSAQEDALEHGRKALAGYPEELDAGEDEDYMNPDFDDDGPPPWDDDDPVDPDPVPRDPDPDPDPDPDSDLDPDPADDEEYGESDSGYDEEDIVDTGADIAARTITPSGIGDIQGVSDIPRIYRKAGSMSSFLNAMGGMGFLANLAGVGIPVIAGGALAGFVAKRILGKTREGTFKNLAKSVDAPLDVSQIPDTPVEPISAEEAKSDFLAQAEKDTEYFDQAIADNEEFFQQLDQENLAGGDAGDADAAGGRGDIYVFRGKGGKGMQSQLAKGGIKGADMSALLKGLRADLTAAGFNVLEEAKRETISLDKTLSAIDQMKDPAQKETAKSAVVQLLRKHKVRLDPKSSMALKPGGGEEEAVTGAGHSQDVVDQDGNVVKKGVGLDGDAPKKGDEEEFDAMDPSAWAKKFGGGEDPPEINTQNRTPEKPHAPLVSYAKDVKPEPGSEADKIQKAQAARAAKSNAAQQSRGAAGGPSGIKPSGQSAEDEDELRRKRNLAAANAPKKKSDQSWVPQAPPGSRKTPRLAESQTLDRWKKLAGIIKG